MACSGIEGDLWHDLRDFHQHSIGIEEDIFPLGHQYGRGLHGMILASTSWTPPADRLAIVAGLAPGLVPDDMKDMNGWAFLRSEWSEWWRVTSERTRTQSLESHWSLGKELDRKMVEMINDYPALPTQNMGLRF